MQEQNEEAGLDEVDSGTASLELQLVQSQGPPNSKAPSNELTHPREESAL